MLRLASALVPVRVGVVTFTPTELPAIVLAATLLGPAPAVTIALADTVADTTRRRPPPESIGGSFLPTRPLECIAASLTGLVAVVYGEMGVADVVGVLPFMLLGAHLLRELIRSRERWRSSRTDGAS